MSVVLEPKLVQTKVLVLVQKAERGLLIKQFLKAFTVHAEAVSTIYEAFQYAKAHLPHIVLSELQVSDGSIFDLKGKFSTTTDLNPCQIVALSSARNDKEKDKMRSLGIETLALTQLDPKSFASAFITILRKMAFKSPYAIERPTAELMTVSSEATVIGRLDDHLILRSGIMMGNRNDIACKPADDLKSACTLPSGRDIYAKNRVFQVVPLRGLSGPCLSWVSHLPDLKKQGVAAQPIRKLLYVHVDPTARAATLKVLKAYHFDVSGVGSEAEAIALLKKMPAEFAVVYVHCAAEQDIAKELLDAREAVPEASRPSLIASVSHLRTSTLNHLRYLPRPFGLGTLLDALHAAYMTAQVLEGSNAQGNVDGAGMPATLHAAVQLVILDEEGGVFEAAAPFQSGTRIKFSTPPVPGLWVDEWRFMVVNCRPVKDRPVWQVRFEIQQSGVSPAKYLQQLKLKFAPAA